jgi:dihydrofolate reductase
VTARGVAISMIAAVSENGVIGVDGGLPWRLPEDLKRFRRLTTGHTVLMGRRTFAERNRPLPDRRNVVVTRDASFAPDGVWVSHSIEAGFDRAVELEREHGGDTMYVIGGETLFRALLDRADRLDLTIVHADVPGDTRFPAFDEDAWRLTLDERHGADERHAHAYSFRVYERAGSGGG